METLKLGQPLATRESQVLLDPALKPGRYRAQLVVVTSGGESVPAEILIVVREQGRIDPRLVTPVPVDRRILGRAAPVPAPAPDPAPTLVASPKSKATSRATLSLSDMVKAIAKPAEVTAQPTTKPTAKPAAKTAAKPTVTTKPKAVAPQPRRAPPTKPKRK